MTTPSQVVIRGKRIPDWKVQDQDGEAHQLWDYRQKSHLLLIYEPDSSKDTVSHWISAIEADKKQWLWLNVKILIVKKAPKEMQPGAYAIDRYGILLNSYASGKWNFHEIEKEFLYYEAVHC